MGLKLPKVKLIVFKFGIKIRNAQSLFEYSFKKSPKALHVALHVVEWYA